MNKEQEKQYLDQIAALHDQVAQLLHTQGNLQTKIMLQEHKIKKLTEKNTEIETRIDIAFDEIQVALLADEDLSWDEVNKASRKLKGLTT